MITLDKQYKCLSFQKSITRKLHEKKILKKRPRGAKPTAVMKIQNIEIKHCMTILK